MSVRELIAEVELRVPADAPVGTRHRATHLMTTSEGCHEVAVAARIDARGCRREQHFCDGVRVPLHVLLRLVCPETECPHARMVREQWNSFHVRVNALGQGGPDPHPKAEPLMREVPVPVAGHECAARPATFHCFTPCPNRAHPPLWIEKKGYDLFEDGAYVGGGVVVSQGITRPRLPSIRTAEAYVFARHLEALAIVDAAAGGGRRSC
jgi:hypothetical protein